LEYGHLVRHKNYEACALSALAMFLFQRFHVDGETPPVFVNKAYWNDYLTPTSSSNVTTELSYSSWNNAMNSAYSALNITWTKTTHVYRASGQCCNYVVCVTELNVP
jgi:hypothetical protein